MIKVTREFATAEEAAAWLLGGGELIDDTNTAPAPAAYAPPAPPAAAPAPAAYVPPAPPAAAPAPAAHVAPAPAAPVAAAPAPAAGGITKEMVTDVANKYAQKYKAKAAKAVLAQFGAVSISQIKPEHYAQAYAAFNV